MHTYLSREQKKTLEFIKTNEINSLSDFFNKVLYEEEHLITPVKATQTIEFYIGNEPKSIVEGAEIVIPEPEHLLYDNVHNELMLRLREFTDLWKYLESEKLIYCQLKSDKKNGSPEKAEDKNTDKDVKEKTRKTKLKNWWKFIKKSKVRNEKRKTSEIVFLCKSPNEIYKEILYPIKDIYNKEIIPSSRLSDFDGLTINESIQGFEKRIKKFTIYVAVLAIVVNIILNLVNFFFKKP